MHESVLRSIADRQFPLYLFFDQEFGVSTGFTELALITAIGDDRANIDFSIYSLHRMQAIGHCKAPSELKRTIEETATYSAQNPGLPGFLA